MRIKESIDKAMEDVNVDEQLKQSILNETVRSSKVTRLVHRRLHPVAAAMAGVLLMGSISVAAAQATGWDQKLADLFHVNETAKQELVEQGYADILQEDNTKDVLTASKNGITVTATQTLGDKYGTYIYLDVKSENSVKLTSDELIFDTMKVLIDGKESKSISWDSGFVEKKYAVSDYERGYYISILKQDGLELSGKEITISLNDLLGEKADHEEYVEVSGEWELNWNASESDEMKSIALNKEITVDGKTIELTNLEFSPLSYNLTYTAKAESGEDFDHVFDVQFIMEDGTVYNDPDGADEYYVATGVCICNFDNNEAGLAEGKETQGFGKVLNTQNVKYISIDGEIFSVQ